MTYFGNISVKSQDSISIDAFGRWRVAQPVTIFDSKQIFDNQPLFWDDSEVSGSGTTSTHSTDAARTRIGVALNTAGKRVRQTFQRFNYQPGKSQLILLTTVMSSAGASGVTSTVGQFDDDNGIFFQMDETTLKVGVRSSVTGSAVDTKVSQSSFNLDTMDGTGPSGVTIDTTKTQILFIDYEWLGVGRVRMGFVIDGIPIYCHEFLNANNLDVVYMSTPNLPLRYEIENDGTGAATTMDHICSTVISEGGSEENGVVRSISTDGTHLDADTENTTYALIGLRLKSTHLGQTVNLLNADLQLHTGTDKILWELIWNPTVAGTFTYADVTNSGIQRALGATANTISGGTVIASGFVESGGAVAGNAGRGSSQVHNSLRLGAAIDGTRDEIVLCVTPIAGSTNVDVEGCLAWRELV